jgi:hypothetical protein
MDSLNLGSFALQFLDRPERGSGAADVIASQRRVVALVEITGEMFAIKVADRIEQEVPLSLEI